MSKRIVVIGGGFTGLAVGCYARMNGYEVDVFEQHKLTGGLCTAWKRRGYVFDGCVHWLVGSDPNSALGRIWQELGVLSGQQIVNPDIFRIIEDRNNNRLTIYTDPQRLKAEMLRLAPEDARQINHFIALLEKLQRPDSPARMLKAPESKSLRWLVTWLPMLIKYSRLSVQDYVMRFKNPFLRWALLRGWDIPGLAFFGMLMTMAWLADKNAGYPIGGSLQLAQALERRALQLGCRIHTETRVEKVLVEGNTAVGIRLAGGEEHRADYVVNAADLHSLIYNLLDGRYGSEKQKGYFDTLPLFESLMLVSFGVKRSFADFPKGTSSHIIELPEKRVLAGALHNTLSYRIFNFDPTLAPDGSTVVQVSLEAPYDHWRRLSQNPAEYEAAKQAVAAECADILSTRFPGFKESIEVVDVASPTTFERYTSNWRGSFEGWVITSKTMMMKMPKTLAGLKGLYLAGQWVQPGGGLPASALTARQITEVICQKDGKAFHAELAPLNVTLANENPESDPEPLSQP